MCQACAVKIDPDKAEQFGDTFLSILNGAGLAMMISIGHRVGVFDTMDRVGAATSEEIAAAAV